MTTTLNESSIKASCYVTLFQASCSSQQPAFSVCTQPGASVKHCWLEPTELQSSSSTACCQVSSTGTQVHDHVTIISRQRSPIPKLMSRPDWHISRHLNLILFHNSAWGRSQWPSGLRRGSADDRLLGLRVRIPPGAWMVVCCKCCVFVR